jgi:hypothetical protein
METAPKHRSTDAQMHRNTDAQKHRSTDAPMHQSTDVRRLTIALPEFMYRAIHNLAGRKGVRKKQIIVGMLRQAAFARSILKDITTNINDLNDRCNLTFTGEQLNTLILVDEDGFVPVESLLDESIQEVD